MKTLKLISLLVLVTTMISCTNQSSNKKNEIMFTTWSIIDNKLTKQDNFSFQTYKEIYDDSNNLIEVINYIKDSVFITTKFTYENGQKILKEQFDNSSQLMLSASFGYDIKNNLSIERINNIKIGQKLIVKYFKNSEGNLIKKEFYDENNNQLENWLYKLSSDGDLKKEIVEHFKNEKLMSTTISIYNSYGLEIEKTQSYPDKATESKYTYQYEMHPNKVNDWIVRQVYVNDSLILEYRKE